MDVKYLPLLVGLLLGVFNFLEKIAISKYGLNYQESAVIKFTVAAMFLWIVNCSASEPMHFSGDKYGYLCLVLSGILNALAILILYYSFRVLDVSVAIPVYSTTAIIVISIFGTLLLDEKFNLFRIAGVTFCIVGIFLILHNGD
jgi:uncharacterized membrane protein